MMKSIPKRGFYTIVSILVLTGQAGAQSPSRVLVPMNDINIGFSHRQHTKEVGCVSCHKRAPASVRSSDSLIPEAESCLSCHKTSRSVPTHTQSAFIKSNHRVHQVQGINCESCHGNVATKDAVTPSNSLPRMSTCTACHNGTRASDACRLCHLTERDNRLRVRFPSGTLTPQGQHRADRHDAVFKRRHGVVARKDARACEHCHAQRDCQTCHNHVIRPLDIHPGDWLHIHALPAKRQNPDCQSCHRSQTFCISCHQRSRVVADPPNRIDSVLKLHPQGWTAPQGAIKTANHHKYAAQRSIGSCVSCHEESSCIRCHSVVGKTSTSRGIRPHPLGFATSAACRNMQSKNRTMCLKCHHNATELSGRCR